MNQTDHLLRGQSFSIGYAADHINAIYRVSALNSAKYTGDMIVSGSVLVAGGIEISLIGDYDNTAVVLEREGK